MAPDSGVYNTNRSLPLIEINRIITNYNDYCLLIDLHNSIIQLIINKLLDILPKIIIINYSTKRQSKPSRNIGRKNCRKYRIKKFKIKKS